MPIDPDSELADLECLKCGGDLDFFSSKEVRCLDCGNQSELAPDRTLVRSRQQWWLNHIASSVILILSLILAARAAIEGDLAWGGLSLLIGIVVVTLEGPSALRAFRVKFG